MIESFRIGPNTNMVLERDEMKEDRLLYYPLALSLASPGLIEDSTMFCNPLFNPHEEAETSTLPQKERQTSNSPRAYSLEERGLKDLHFLHLQ